jgi:hypothetical protein
MQRGKNWLGEEGILWLTRARETTGSLKCSLLQYKAGEANNDSYLKKVMCTLYFAVVVMDFVRTVRSITSYSWISQWFFSFFGVAVFPLSARGRVPYGAVRQSFPGTNAALRATDGLHNLWRRVSIHWKRELVRPHKIWSSVPQVWILSQTEDKFGQVQMALTGYWGEIMN